MDLEEQGAIERVAAQHAKGDLVVVLGSPSPEAAQMVAETVTTGDPAFAGPLAGVSLGLPVYHILEPEIQQQIDPAIREEQLGLMEMALDVEAILDEVRRVREASLAE